MAWEREYQTLWSVGALRPTKQSKTHEYGYYKYKIHEQVFFYSLRWVTVLSYGRSTFCEVLITWIHINRINAGALRRLVQLDVQWTGTVHCQNGTPRHWNSILKIGTVYWQTCTIYWKMCAVQFANKVVQHNILTNWCCILTNRYCILTNRYCILTNQYRTVTKELKKKYIM